MFKVMACIVSVLFSVGSFSQTTTIGLEVSYVSDVYTREDAGGWLDKPDLTAALWGVTIRHMVAKPLFLESGLYTRMNREGILFKDWVGGTGTGRQSYALPLRVGLRIPIFKDRLFISPVAGYILSLADDSKRGGTEGVSTTTDGTRIAWKYDTRYPVQTYSMLQGGIGIDIRIFRKALLSIIGNYYAGLDKIWIQDITYSIDNGVQQTAKGYVKGTCYAIGIGFNYPIGKN